MVLGSELGLAEGRLPGLASGAQLAPEWLCSIQISPLAKLTRKTDFLYQLPHPHAVPRIRSAALGISKWTFYLTPIVMPASFIFAFHCVLKTSSKVKYCPHFADEETESQRGEVSCPRPHQW